MIRISIAMASYNGERFIREQLDSYAAQSRLPDQLIICDDGSIDRTIPIVEEFAASAPFPVIISRNSRNLGYSRNFARALTLCDGDIIFLSDQDDVWFPDRVERVISVFETDPDVQVVVNDQLLADAELRHRGVTKLENLRRAGKKSSGMIEGCSTALRLCWARSLFPMPAGADALIASGALSHDRWINELAILLSRRAVIDRPLQYFRRTGENTTSWLLSEPRSPSLTDRIRGRQPTAPVKAWHARIAVLDCYQRFIASRPISGDIVGAEREIAHERLSHERRVRLVSMPRWRRPAAVWRLWRSGGYRYFEGWMSAANDIVR
jgi:glycosyltransferase involved in cell wall biosynthesis